MHVSWEHSFFSYNLHTNYSAPFPLHTQSPPIYTAQTEYISLKAHPPCHRVPEPGKGFTSCWINFRQSGLFTHVWPFHGRLACAAILNPSHCCNYENRVVVCKCIESSSGLVLSDKSINHYYYIEGRLRLTSELMLLNTNGIT